ncbi:NADH-quinone oxidoreductase subunit C [Streptomyces afghaniensis]|uniref:NADH-quinone oxidoreductase subunit C n=1 Tax=Streptomyces afghaniensis TaxID=66865 RepID=UPI0037D8B678
MTAVGWLPADVEELFGTDATAEESYEVLTVDVPPTTWISALETARDRLTCTYFDWLSAVDEPGTGLRVTAHVAALSPLRRLLLRTTVPHESPTLPSAVGVYAGAAWHERETHEMFGIAFEGHPALDHLLLPENFEGHPLRKDFVLAARVAKAWPGAKEPGESEHGGPKRRQMLPPGVPDPNEWGPLKGQLPPAPARGAGRTAGDRPARGTARPAGERPVRRTRTAGEGSASQAATGESAAPGSAGPRRSRSAAEGSASQAAAGDAATPSAAAPRRARTAAEGSASQTSNRPEATTSGPEAATSGPEPTTSGSEATTSGPEPTTSGSEARATEAESAATATGAQPPVTEPESPDTGPGTPAASPEPRRARSASDGSASQQAQPDAAAGPRRARSASEGSGSQRADSGPGDSRPGRAARPPRSSDAPWHHARPAFEEPAPEPSPEAGALPTPEPSDDPKTPNTTSESPDTPEPSEPANNPQPTDNPEDPTGGPR